MWVILFDSDFDLSFVVIHHFPIFLSNSMLNKVDVETLRSLKLRPSITSGQKTTRQKCRKIEAEGKIRRRNGKAGEKLNEMRKRKERKKVKLMLLSHEIERIAFSICQEKINRKSNCMKLKIEKKWDAEEVKFTQNKNQIPFIFRTNKQRSSEPKQKNRNVVCIMYIDRVEHGQVIGSEWCEKYSI